MAGAPRGKLGVAALVAFLDLTHVLSLVLSRPPLGGREQASRALQIPRGAVATHTHRASSPQLSSLLQSSLCTATASVKVTNDLCVINSNGQLRVAHQEDDQGIYHANRRRRGRGHNRSNPKRESRLGAVGPPATRRRPAGSHFLGLLCSSLFFLTPSQVSA